MRQAILDTVRSYNQRGIRASRMDTYLAVKARHAGATFDAVLAEVLDMVAAGVLREDLDGPDGRKLVLAGVDIEAIRAEREGLAALRF